MWNDRFANRFTADMAFDPITMTVMAAVGTAVSAAGTLAGGAAAADAGRARQASEEYQAKQYEQNALTARAEAQRQSFEKQRQTSLLQSTLQARAAAGGGSASDPGIVKLGEEIASRGEYESLMEMFKGENRARGLEDQATASRMTGEAALAEGKAKQKASYLSAAGTLIGGASSMYKTYNKIPAYG